MILIIKNVLYYFRYGRVQSVKFLHNEGDGPVSAAVAFVDIRSASKAHNAINKCEDRTLKTDYYEPACLGGRSIAYPPPTVTPSHNPPSRQSRYQG